MADRDLLLRVQIEDVTVSTVYMSQLKAIADMVPNYETAIINSEGRVEPVENYPNRFRAVIGHAQWVKKVEDEYRVST